MRNVIRILVTVTIIATFSALIAGCSLVAKRIPSCEKLLAISHVDAEKSVEISVIVAPTSTFTDFEVLAKSMEGVVQKMMGDKGSRLNVVLADGTPGLAASIDIDGSRFEVDKKNDQESASEAVADVYSCVVGSEYVSNTIPTEPELDLFQSLRVAADSFDVKNESSSKHIIVLSNGLQTAGQFQMQKNGIPAMSTVNSIVGGLAASRALPDLKGATVDIIGLGHVGPADQRLNQQSIDSLAAFWTAIIEASHGRVGTIQREGFGDGQPSAKSIKVSPVVGQKDACISATVTEDDGARFKPGTAEFTDPSAAATSAKKIADQLAAKQGCTGTVTVTGYVASTTPKAQYVFGNAPDAQLSRARAEAFKALLIQQGVKVSISAVGGGKGPYVDWDAQGNYVESLGKTNRIVSVTQ